MPLLEHSVAEVCVASPSALLYQDMGVVGHWTAGAHASKLNKLNELPSSQAEASEITKPHLQYEQSGPEKPGKHVQVDSPVHSPFKEHEFGHPESATPKQNEMTSRRNQVGVEGC